LEISASDSNYLHALGTPKRFDALNRIARCLAVGREYCLASLEAPSMEAIKPSRHWFNTA
jgi:hypothetical protein